MASKLTRDEVAHIADLARLDLSSSEIETFARQLTDILSYAATVQEAETTGVGGEPSEPSEPPEPPEPSSRPDLPSPSLSRDEVLSQAPDAAREAGLFRVPKVL
jgi:aspartyl-tRNA(Asn)/glutamyl-tRNA(Gln) amidotransferase subunit C